MDLHIKLALEMDDGTVTVMAFATRSRSPTLPSGARWLDGTQALWERTPDDKNIQAEINKAFPGVNQLGIKRPTCVAYHRIEDADLPAQRDYRNAWEFVGGKVTENLAKAKEIHRDRLRRERTELLVPLDIEVSKSIAIGDLAAAQTAESQRQALRDITEDPRIDAATSVDELRQITVQSISAVPQDQAR